MTTSARNVFLAGVIEGFYGRPWSMSERLELFEWLEQWGLNFYLYGPKDDLKHRATWRESYNAAELEELRPLASACSQRSIEFAYALSPGLDIHYADPAETQILQERFAQLLALGCRNFCLLFDDIPDRIRPADLARYGSFAAAQCAVVNEMFRWTRQQQPAARFYFCPTPYCGRMAAHRHGGAGYLETIGRELLPEVDVFWTGPEIISREITTAHVAEVAALLRRPPLIWDNLHANDYDSRRFYCGPYSGRPPELRDAVRGLLCNPNTEFPLNFVPLRTLADFVHQQGTWNARSAWRTAMQEWLPRFATVGKSLTIEDLLQLGDCHYLPFEDGEGANTLYARAHRLIHSDPAEWGGEAGEFCRQTAHLKELCHRLTELRDRALFHALSRRLWDLREELDLLERYVASRSEPETRDRPFRSDFHLPGTYRGGLVARLQGLLEPHPDGTFTPHRTPDGKHQPKPDSAAARHE